MSKLLKDVLKLFSSRPDEIVDKAIGVLSFRPKVLEMLQVPPANMRIPGVPRILGYRYPAPASREAPNVPDMPADRHYDITRYPRDNRNIKPDNVVFMPPRVKAYLETGSDVTHPLLGAGEPQPKKGSPGNKNPAVLRYDPTGLRSTMSATWAETDKSLELHRPHHLPRAEWVEDYDKMLKKAEENGLPPPIGRPLRMRYQRIIRTAHW
ncbi:hypothetical protein JKP88DRAFT_264748 [Tribonema minus]|uniref:Uncharacterized protein n=1 Tax=Tribonema minus TaxID=303371 RepID=A0A835YW15_9STRA|nr:hypothetical protein JKP88DRAFT_264748 [Tribonema minus]|eukprot:TRINITY_DN3508_c0_g1_i1.p1 TRINITY_DN3508_c0_g1~~TRINITY_DN3508_c0_g1_i1.p1  ORF type:complete len:227 (-),score=49.64 TRINITY_DN3508_c0_g1_i1:66-692(-)